MQRGVLFKPYFCAKPRDDVKRCMKMECVLPMLRNANTPNLYNLTWKTPQSNCPPF
jgi:hypothetical protein